MKWTCPCCKQEAYGLINEKGKYKQFVFPVKHPDGSYNWKHLFRIEWSSILLVLAIVLLVFGVKQINSQCLDIVAHPCEKLAGLNCEAVNAQQIFSADVADSSVIIPSMNITDNITGNGK